ncbi:MAG: hypothetical protein AAF662_01515 [Pseudomonadota bacterium]
MRESRLSIVVLLFGVLSMVCGDHAHAHRSTRQAVELDWHHLYCSSDLVARVLVVRGGRPNQPEYGIRINKSYRGLDYGYLVLGNIRSGLRLELGVEYLIHANMGDQSGVLDLHNGLGATVPTAMLTEARKTWLESTATASGSFCDRDFETLFRARHWKRYYLDYVEAYRRLLRG